MVVRNRVVKALAIGVLLIPVVWAVVSMGIHTMIVTYESDEPGFPYKDGSYSFECLNEATGEGGSAIIEFTENGRWGRITSSGKIVFVDFEGADIMTDRYSCNDASLRIDPEVYVTIGDRHLGPCVEKRL